MDVDENENGNGTIILISSDGQRFEVPGQVASLSALIKDTIGDADEDDSEADTPIEIELINVTADVLTLVVQFFLHYMEEEMTPITTPLASNELSKLVQPWYAEFVKIDRELLFDLVAAANYMNIKPLLDLSCLAVSILIKGKSAVELRSMFKIQPELTAEEQAQIEREGQWLGESNPASRQDNNKNELAGDESSA